MRIDRTHRSWLAFSVVTLVGAAAIYFFEVTRGRAAIVGYSSGSACGSLEQCAAHLSAELEARQNLFHRHLEECIQQGEQPHDKGRAPMQRSG